MRVDFYLLSESEPKTKGLAACRIIEKAYLKGHQLYVFCESKLEAEALDELLWNFKEDSFIPHHLTGEGPEPPAPIQIGWEGSPRGSNDILVNLSSLLPDFHTRFKRVLEVVLNEEQEKEKSRQRYRQYRAGGCELFTHELV